jgi:hypothetical protein
METKRLNTGATKTYIQHSALNFIAYKNIIVYFKGAVQKDYNGANQVRKGFSPGQRYGKTANAQTTNQRIGRQAQAAAKMHYGSQYYANCNKIKTKTYELSVHISRNESPHPYYSTGDSVKNCANQPQRSAVPNYQKDHC